MSPEHLILSHLRARAGQAEADRDFLRELANRGQTPDALYIGCSDSRVVPEHMTASSPGRIFVVRNVANLVPPFSHAAISVGAAIEFGVTVLGVPHLVVCGHDGCGGVEAALEGKDLRDAPSLGEWLRGVEPAVRAVADLPPEQRMRRAVELNVLNQVENLRTFPIVQAAVAAGRLQLHAWVYDIHTLALRIYDAASKTFQPAQPPAEG